MNTNAADEDAVDKTPMIDGTLPVVTVTRGHTPCERWWYDLS